MKLSTYARLLPALLLASIFWQPVATLAQETAPNESPSSALVAALSAACRADPNQFANYLTADSAAAFRTITDAQRVAFLRRFALADGAGKPLLSSSDANRPVLRCEAPEVTVEFRLGEARTHDNLAFIPVDVANSERTQFGLVRENGAWRLLSLGLVLLDVPQLAKEWAQEAAQEALAAQESAAVDALTSLREAIETYHRAFGMLPDALANLGPAPKDGISPERASLVKENLANGRDNGYEFSYRTVALTGSTGAQYEIAAIPQTYGKTGVSSFFMDADGKIHAADHEGAEATGADPVFNPTRGDATHAAQQAPYSSSSAAASFGSQAGSSAESSSSSAGSAAISDPR